MIGGDRSADKMRFKYRTDFVKDETGKKRPVPRPRIEIVFRKYPDAYDKEKNPEFRTSGLVDSGADISFIPKQIADILQLDRDEKTKKKSKSASEEFYTYRANVYLEVIYKGRRVGIDSVEVAIPEKDKLEGEVEHRVLLGRQGLFDKYEIIFNQDEKTVTLRRTKDKGKKKRNFNVICHKYG